MDTSLGLIGSKPTQQKEKQGNQMRSLDQIIQNAGKRMLEHQEQTWQHHTFQSDALAKQQRDLYLIPSSCEGSHQSLRKIQSKIEKGWLKGK